MEQSIFSDGEVAAIVSLAFLLIGIPFGLVAILIALLRLSIARALGKIGLYAGSVIASVLGLATCVLFPSFAALFFLLLLAIPAILGGATLGIVHFNKDRPPLNRFQIPLSAILFFILIAALAAGAVRWKQEAYYYERDQLLRNFREMPSIDKVTVHTHDYNNKNFVDSIQFSIAGRPGTLIRIHQVHPEMLTCQSSDHLQHLLIQQIGPWTFGGRGRGTYTYQDGSSETTSFRYPYLSLGIKGQHRDLIELKIESVDDVVKHYDEMIVLLQQTWPRESKPGRLQKDNEWREYWAELDPNFSDGVSATKNGAAQ